MALDKDNATCDPAARDREPRKPKFKRRADERADEILDAALELFAERSFTATRVEDIAARAGVSKGTVYLYFDSKKSLLEALVKRALVPISERLIASVDATETDPRETFRSFGKLLTSEDGQSGILAVPGLVMKESKQFPELSRSLGREVLEKVRPQMVAMIERQIELGAFRKVDPELAFRSVVGPMFMHLMTARMFDVFSNDEPKMDRMVAQYVELLMDGLSAERQSSSTGGAEPVSHGETDTSNGGAGKAVRTIG